jgi:nucleotide-binding universal stress UspA family protein
MLAIDKKPDIDDVVKFAIDLAKWREDEIYAIHVISGKRGVDNDKIIKDAMLFMDRIKDRAAAFGVFLTPLLESGSVYESVLKAALDKKVDVIVLGSTNHGSGEPGVGSVSEYVVHHAHCTVVVVK